MSIGTHPSAITDGGIGPLDDEAGAFRSGSSQEAGPIESATDYARTIGSGRPLGLNSGLASLPPASVSDQNRDL